MGHRIQAIILDMDGTLVDTEGFWELAEIDLLASRGIVYNSGDYSTVVGLATEDVIAEMRIKYGLEDEDPDALIHELHERVKRLLQLHAAPAKPGAAELVKHILKKGIPCAIASNSPAEIVKTALAKQSWAENITIRCSVDDVARGKPAPDLYQLAAARLNVSPANCVAIEDSPGGARAAIAAGMLCFAVPDPEYASATKFREITPYVFGDLREVLSKLMTCE